MKTKLIITFLIINVSLYTAKATCTVTIPDMNFKNALLTNSAINTNLDAEIQCSEALAYTGVINVNNMGIADLTGIEAFVNITGLDCSQNALTSLDPTANVALTTIYCFHNQILSLDLSSNTTLATLFCYENQLSTLDLSHNPALTLLYCDNNQLTSLNIQNGNNSNLIDFGSSPNPLLSCVQVDDANFMNINFPFSIDLWTSYSTNCIPVCTTPDATISNTNGLALNCTVQNTTLSVPAPSGTSQVWTHDGIFFSSAFNPVVTQAGVYEVVVTDGACSDSSSVTITLDDAPPTVGFNASDTAICNGSSVTLTATGNAVTNTWNGGITDATPFVPFSGIYIYTLTGTAANGCTATSSVTITVADPPHVGILSQSHVNICVGNPTLTLNAYASIHVTNFDWYFDNGSGYMYLGSGATLMPGAPNATDAGLWTIVCVGSEGTACPNDTSFTLNLNVVALPNTTATATASSVCAGSSVMLNGGGALYYSWDNGVSDSVAFTPTMDTTYTVTGMNFYGCTTTASVMVTVVTPAIAGIATISTTNLCVGDGSLVLSVTGYNDSTSLGWYFNDGGGFFNVGSGAAFMPGAPDSTNAGAWQMMCVADNGMVCPTDTSNVLNLMVNALPIVTLDLSTMDTLCQNWGIINLVGESPSGGTFSGVGVTGNTFDAGITSGINTVTYTYSDANTCTSSASADVFVDVCSSIAAGQEGSIISVYPNPCTNELGIRNYELGMGVVEMYDVLGSRVLQSEITNPQSEISVDISALAKGIYFLRIISEGTEVFSQKVIKQ